MDRHTVNSLIMQHAMGQAYLDITATMGPSLQLLAFVNFEKVTSNSVGLESFNAVEQHEQVLAEIESSTALEQAWLGMAARLEHLLQNSDDSIATEGFIGKFLRHTFTGLPTYTSYSNAKTYIKALDSYLSVKMSKLPSDMKLATWQKFDSDMASELEKLNKEANAITGKKISNLEYDGNVSFKKSGWTQEKYDAEMHWLEQERSADKARGEKYHAKVEKLKSMIAEFAKDKSEDSSKTATIVNRQIGKLEDLSSEIELVDSTVGPMLARVKKYLD